MERKSIGIVGLGVMGRNLALNFAEKGYFVAAFDPWPEARESLTAQLRDKEAPELADNIFLATSEKALVNALKPPRSLLLMVKAGETVDQQINAFASLLEANDCLIDGGNSHFEETIRREKNLRSLRLRFLGLGISGGEEGARHGPSMMAGGDPTAYGNCAEMLEAIAAKFDQSPCCALVGSDGAGHFVKTVHNGIEYAIMQILAESYLVMRDVFRLDNEWCSRIFAEWNETALSSYLVEITSKVLARSDYLAKGSLVDIIMDKAGQKGTGKWSSQAAFDYGVPANTIAEAVFARAMASMKEQRVDASKRLHGPICESAVAGDVSIGCLRDATLCAVIVAYAQGLSLIAAASKDHGWQTDLADVADIWRSGCVIRADLLDDIAKAYRQTPSLANLMCAEPFTEYLANGQTAWRAMIKLAIDQGVPVPAFSSALAYYDGYRTERSSANLLQAQRDYFGAHTYERLDRQGSFHTEW
ncbi:NADP-dependent phosphogluconate dehydrogenase [Cohaesibacter intestini]|uniref:NADP-dependent phosphogluconate dehydrogenase n=1 Tax=Cohaesibacter intestini TaxID=2211145 RepID=UPI000DE8847F|nr:NADP-dependent phosphogluconate dehydrogenase [Cohaesibacter intestini]